VLALAGPVALLVLVNVIFAGYTTLSAAAFSSGTSPVVFAFLRDLTACCCFVPALLFFERRGARCPRAEHWGHIICLAALGVWGSQLMSALAISNLSPAVYGMLKPAVPAVTMALAVALGMQPCSARARSSQLKALGVLAAVGGAVSVVAASGEEREAKS
jgi:drug/metabolite transporter (DMT)-like permease